MTVRVVVYPPYTRAPVYTLECIHTYKRRIAPDGNGLTGITEKTWGGNEG